MALETDSQTPSWPYGNQEVRFDIEAGLSSKLADLDNVLKPLFDTYQTIYEEFNDKTVYEIRATKVLVPRGDEYISVEVRSLAEEVSEEPEEEIKSQA